MTRLRVDCCGTANAVLRGLTGISLTAWIIAFHPHSFAAGKSPRLSYAALGDKRLFSSLVDLRHLNRDPLNLVQRDFV